MTHTIRASAMISATVMSALACTSAVATAQGQGPAATAGTQPSRSLFGVQKPNVPAAPSREAPQTAQRSSGQTSDASPPGVPNEPQRTTASFGEWTLRCEKPAEGPKLCEVFTSIVATNQQGQSSTIAQVAIGRTAKTEPLRVTVVLPVSVSFSTTPKLAADEKGKPFADLGWRRCMPNGCYADAVAEDAILREMKARPEAARINFKDAGERELSLPVASRGLAQALDALGKEAF